MSALRIDSELCTGCGLCLQCCSSEALTLAEGQAVVDEQACLLCGICVDACPCQAISIPREQPQADSQARGIWVFAEQSHGGVLPVTYELLGKGRELAAALHTNLTALLLGKDVAASATKLIQAGADTVLLIEDDRLEHNLEISYCQQLWKLVQEYQPEILLFGATSFGRSLAPRLAARLQTGLTADCTVLEAELSQRLLLQTRPAFGGNLLATIITPRHRPQMATVRPGIMTALPLDPARQGQIITKSFDPHHGEPLQLLAERGLSQDSISDAEILVVAGRGIGSAKNLAYVRELAEALGGVMGCTRPLVDTGWCEYKYQIGQTGCAVAPKLLISCGVSGAIQHVAGIANAKTIIAINTDPQAPIFQLAHYKVVGDCLDIIKALL